MRQVFPSGEQFRTVSNSTTNYHQLFNNRYVETWTTTETAQQQIIPDAGTFDNLYVKLAGSPGAGKSYQFTLMVNGVASALTCTVSDTNTTASDTSNSVSVSAGDLVSLRCVPSGTPTAREVNGWCIEYTSDTAKYSIYPGGSTANMINSATRYTGFLNPIEWDKATESDASDIVTIDGTIKAFYVEVTDNPTPGSWTFKVYKNGVAEATTTVSLSGTTKTGNATGLSIDVAPGDKLSYECVPTSSPTATQARVGIAIEADNDGEFVLGGHSTDNLSNSATEFLRHSASNANWTWNTNESLRNATFGVTTTYLSDMRVELSGAPGVGTSFTVGLEINGSAGSNSVTISDGDTSGVDSTNEDEYAQGDYINMYSTPSNTPSVSWAKWAMTGNVTSSGGSTFTPRVIMIT